MAKKTELTEKLKTLLVIVTGLVVIAIFTKSKGVLYAAGIISVTSLAIPIIGDWIIWIWFKIAEVLGWINSRILLSVIFFVFLYPIALISRLSVKNLLQLKRVKEKSVYVERNHKYTKEDLENIF